MSEEEEKPTVGDVYAILCRKAVALREKLIEPPESPETLKKLEQKYAATITVRDDLERMINNGEG